MVAVKERKEKVSRAHVDAYFRLHTPKWLSLDISAGGAASDSAHDSPPSPRVPTPNPPIIRPSPSHLILVPTTPILFDRPRMSIRFHKGPSIITLL